MEINNKGNKITNPLSNIYNLHTNFNENFEKHQQVKSEKKNHFVEEINAIYG